MRVLVACEFSGVVREAFRKRGHDAYSCDLIPALDGSRFHLQKDARRAITEDGPWDALIAHPNCDRLLVAGALHWRKWQQSGEQQKGIVFFMEMASRSSSSKARQMRHSAFMSGGRGFPVE